MGSDPSSLVRPSRTAVLTQECQKGVLGEESLVPRLRQSGLASGALTNMGRVVGAAREAGCSILHAVASHRADLRGASANGPMFVAIARSGRIQLEGSPLVEVIDEIPLAESDLTSTRYHGVSPFAGTDVDSLLRNLGVHTVVVVGASTNVGVTNAVLDAVNLGYQVVVVRDAIVGWPDDYAEAVVDNSLSLVATVVTTDDLVAAWEE